MTILPIALAFFAWLALGWMSGALAMVLCRCAMRITSPSADWRALDREFRGYILLIRALHLIAGPAGLLALWLQFAFDPDLR